MIPKLLQESISLSGGRDITIETGRLAKQADGSVVVRSGDTMLLATVVSSRHINDVIDFLPLTIDYREKFASSGRFPGGFFKREARPSDREVLTMRLVDRVLRPLFPKDYYAEIQVMIQLISHDENVMPDALVGLAASSCLALSDIPFETLISEVRVGRVNGDLVINPSKNELIDSDIDVMIGASKDTVMMVEGEMKEISESEFLEIIRFGHNAIKEQCLAQENLVKQVGKKPTREYEKKPENAKLEKEIREFSYDKCYEIAKKDTSKQELSNLFSKLNELCKEKFLKDDKENLIEEELLINKYFQKTQKEAVRNLILNEGIRLDGRKLNEIRYIWSEVDYLPSTHGSSVFTRGETQSLTTVTLGTSREANIIDLPTDQSEERFYLHYNFPPFSTGEARPLRGTSRREIGHGNLAQRALKNVISTDCPYTVRIVSEILESNGSSSMATVCAGSLALMDAGVKISSPVSGIAMGLISDGEKYAVLSDILGDEDHLGDMDFKVTGTRDGITACQMDIKIKELSYEILEKALVQAKEGRLHILDKMLETIDKPRKEVKNHAPKIIKLTIPKDYIGAFIGPGGKNIQAVQEETQTTIVIEEKDNQGIVEILGVNPVGIKTAIAAVEACTFEPKVGEVYLVKAIKILDFGAVVEFMPGKEVLLHISEISKERIKNVTDVINIGDEFKVKYFGIDSRTKKQKISRKALL